MNAISNVILLTFAWMVSRLTHKGGLSSLLGLFIIFVVCIVAPIKVFFLLGADTLAWICIIGILGFWTILLLRKFFKLTITSVILLIITGLFIYWLVNRIVNGVPIFT